MLPLKKSAGAGERDLELYQTISDDGVTCEACGTDYSVRCTWGYFMGKQIVKECCGKLLDKIYLEIGEALAIAFLEDFARNPLNGKFGVFLITLNKALNTAKEKSQFSAEELDKLSKALNSYTN